jgi:hypothetical protein
VIDIDISKAAWLAVVGTPDAEILRAQCTQKVDALWGTTILVVGFLFQALSSVGVIIGGTIAWALVVVLVALFAVFHFWIRARHIRRWYMRAVDAATCEQSVKEEMRRAF